MDQESDLYKFTIAYRNGPWEIFSALKDKLILAGHDIESLTASAEEFFEAGDSYRKAARRGNDLVETEARFRDASKALGLDDEITDSLIISQKKLLAGSGKILKK